MSKLPLVLMVVEVLIGVHVDKGDEHGVCIAQIGDTIARQTFCHGCRSHACDLRGDYRRSSGGSGYSGRTAWCCDG